MTGSPAAHTKGKHLTDIDIGKILRLAKGLIPQRKIASLIKCSQKAIQHTLATYLFETFQGHNPRRNYQRKTYEHEDQYIERRLKQNSDMPLHNITNLIGLSISERTVQRRRSETGLGSYIAAQKPGLWPENVVRKARLGRAIQGLDCGGLEMGDLVEMNPVSGLGWVRDANG